MSNADFSRMLSGYSLTTAEILYRLPDHPSLLQTFLWQDYDIHPKFPKLHGFLEFWQTHLDGKLYKVSVSHRRLISPAELKLVGSELRLH
jgi:uncharacterized protein Usg